MASMASVPAQSLECVICQELYDEPKQLSCTHTFCQKCLADLLDFNNKENELTCPVCRQTTQVEDGEVSKLQTNFPIKSLVEDVKPSEQMCTVCDQGTRSKSVAYCQTCGVYMCISCLDAHGKFKLNRKHEVVDSKDIKSGMVKLKQLCKKHPQEEMEWVCSTCKVPICFRCRMLHHNGPNHEVKEVAEIQKALKDEAKTLQKEAEDTMKVIKDHITVIKEEDVKSCTMLGERVADVIGAFDDSLKKLTEQKGKLVEKLQKHKDDIRGNLQHMEECDLKLFSDISSTRDLITKGAAGFLEGESLVVHQRLCTELKELMSRADCDDKIPRGITERAESIKFTRSQRQQDLKLGELTLPGMDGEAASASPPRTLQATLGDKLWNLKKVGSLSTKGPGVYDMAPTPDGRMAVCYDKGGVDLFTVRGLQETVLEKATLKSIRFLSDGKCSVIESDESDESGESGESYESDGESINWKFSLYSCKWEKVPTPEVQIASSRFEVCTGKNHEILIFHVDEHDGSDTDGNIVLSVYRPDSREFKEVHLYEGNYHDYNYNPDKDALRLMNHRPCYMYVGDNNGYVHVVDAQFQRINSVAITEGLFNDYFDTYMPNNIEICAVVLEDDSILVGWVKEGSVTVDLYTYDLRYLRTVLEDFKLYGKDFLMAAFSTGEIAICDSRLIHVFRKDYEE